MRGHKVIVVLVILVMGQILHGISSGESPEENGSDKVLDQFLASIERQAFTISIENTMLCGMYWEVDSTYFQIMPSKVGFISVKTIRVTRGHMRETIVVDSNHPVWWFWRVIEVNDRVEFHLRNSAVEGDYSISSLLVPTVITSVNPEGNRSCNLSYNQQRSGSSPDLLYCDPTGNRCQTLSSYSASP